MVKENLASNKKLVRDDMVKKRQRLSSDNVFELSGFIAEKLFTTKEFINANAIALYSNKDFEVSTIDIFNRAINLGKKVYYPKTCSSTRALTFFHVKNLIDLILGEFSIMEPKGDTTEIDLSDLDMVIVPGLAFDEKGTRLGFGMGCYDTALADYKGTTVGLCYDFQFVETLPKESFDKPINILITESNIHYFS